MGKLILYGFKESPAVRAVLLTLGELGLDYDYVEVNLMKRENRSEEFLKKNPQHTVPVLEDNGHYIWDSHAIIAFLVRKYAKNDDLYPKDFYKRAIVDQRLHFESGVLFAALKNISLPIFVKNETNITQAKIDAVHDAFNFIEAFLEHDFITGDTLTIADLSLVSTATSFGAFLSIDPAKTPKMVAWINRLSKLPYYQEANAKGAESYVKLLKSILAKK